MKEREIRRPEARDVPRAPWNWIQIWGAGSVPAWPAPIALPLTGKCGLN